MTQSNNTPAQVADFKSAFTLQSIEHKINAYKADAEQFETTVSEQSEQCALVVEVEMHPEGAFACYPAGHCLGYTQALLSSSTTKEDVEEDVKSEIRDWFDLDEDFNIEVTFTEIEEKIEYSSDDDGDYMLILASDENAAVQKARRLLDEAGDHELVDTAKSYYDENAGLWRMYYSIRYDVFLSRDFDTALNGECGANLKSATKEEVYDFLSDEENQSQDLTDYIFYAGTETLADRDEIF